MYYIIYQIPSFFFLIYLIIILIFIKKIHNTKDLLLNFFLITVFIVNFTIMAFYTQQKKLFINIKQEKKDNNLDRKTIEDFEKEVKELKNFIDLNNKKIKDLTLKVPMNLQIESINFFVTDIKDKIDALNKKFNNNIKDRDDKIELLKKFNFNLPDLSNHLLEEKFTKLLKVFEDYKYTFKKNLSESLNLKTIDYTLIDQYQQQLKLIESLNNNLDTNNNNLIVDKNFENLIDFIEKNPDFSEGKNNTSEKTTIPLIYQSKNKSYYLFNSSPGWYTFIDNTKVIKYKYENLEMFTLTEENKEFKFFHTRLEDEKEIFPLFLKNSEEIKYYLESFNIDINNKKLLITDNFLEITINDLDKINITNQKDDMGKNKFYFSYSINKKNEFNIIKFIINQGSSTHYEIVYYKNLDPQKSLITYSITYDKKFAKKNIYSRQLMEFIKKEESFIIKNTLEKVSYVITPCGLYMIINPESIGLDFLQKNFLDNKPQQFYFMSKFFNCLDIFNQTNFTQLLGQSIDLNTHKIINNFVTNINTSFLSQPASTINKPPSFKSNIIFGEKLLKANLGSSIIFTTSQPSKEYNTIKDLDKVAINFFKTIENIP